MSNSSCVLRCLSVRRKTFTSSSRCLVCRNPFCFRNWLNFALASIFQTCVPDLIGLCKTDKTKSSQKRQALPAKPRSVAKALEHRRPPKQAFDELRPRFEGATLRSNFSFASMFQSSALDFDIHKAYEYKQIYYPVRLTKISISPILLSIYTIYILNMLLITNIIIYSLG